MGNLSLCRKSIKKKQSFRSRIGSFATNELLQSVTIETGGIRVEVYFGYCAVEPVDVSINVTDERISQNQSEQETMLFQMAGDRLGKETSEYLAKNTKLSYKFPFYSHAGCLPMSNVIHCTLSENTRTISDT